MRTGRSAVVGSEKRLCRLSLEPGNRLRLGQARERRPERGVGTGAVAGGHAEVADVLPPLSGLGRSRLLTHRNLLVELDGLHGRSGAELALERLAQRTVDRRRLGSPPRQCQHAQECADRLLVRGIDHARAAEQPGCLVEIGARFQRGGELGQHGCCFVMQDLPAGRCPVLVEVFRQELALPQCDSGAVQVHILGDSGLRDRCLELRDVDPSVGPQHQQVTLRDDDLRYLSSQVAHGGACPEDGLAQVVAGGRGIEIGPQRVHDLLAVQSMAGSECKPLDEGLRSALWPIDFVEASSPGAHAEPAEEFNRDWARLQPMQRHPLNVPGELLRQRGVDRTGLDHVKAVRTKNQRPAMTAVWLSCARAAQAAYSMTSGV